MDSLRNRKEGTENADKESVYPRLRAPFRAASEMSVAEDDILACSEALALGEKVSDLVKVGESDTEEEDDAGLIPAWAWRHWKAVSFEALPEWLKDNEFLRHGYRPPLPSVQVCMKSIFRLHTETWNIWTHLLGMIFFVVVAACVFLFNQSELISSLPWYEKIIIGFFFLGAVLCLCCSFLYHTLSCHSPKLSLAFQRLDYTGIAILVTGSSIPCLYYSYYCSQFPRYFHTTIVIILCVACMCVSLWEKFTTPQYRTLRTLVFVTFGLYGVIPAVEVIYREGWEVASSAYSTNWLISMGLIYIAGASLYAARIPERFSPGHFDICLHSHQIFHVAVIIAAWVHYDGLLNMISYRLNIGVECLPTL